MTARTCDNCGTEFDSSNGLDCPKCLPTKDQPEGNSDK